VSDHRRRIAQVEQKIDGLVAKLVNAVDNDAAPDPTPPESPRRTDDTRQDIWRKQGTVAPGSWLPMVSWDSNTSKPDRANEQPIEQAQDGAEADRQYLESLRTIHNFGDREVVSQAPEGIFRPSKRPEPPIEDDLVKQLLATGEADVLLNQYREMSATFPFVILPHGVTSNELHDSKPMLLLAMLTVASCEDHTRQMKLDGIYRTELANRTIISPRRTLGLVQSVLVYLSW
jgi:hypothetical protein